MAQIGTSIERAVLLLEAGKAVAIPTETVYGLACNALNPKAVAEVFRIKNRPKFDPLIVHLSDINKVADLADVSSPFFDKLSTAFWPGPLSLVLPAKDIVPAIVRAGGPTVAIRIPGHPLTQSLLNRLDFPLAAPSANPFGYVSPTKASHVNDQLGNEIDYILDGGSCTVGIESTVIKLYQDKYEILRLGGLSLKLIIEVCGEEPEEVKNSSSRPESPGMLDRHYAPSCKVIDSRKLDISKLEDSFKVGALCFSKEMEGIDSNLQRVLSSGSNYTEAAVNLFAYLRELDALDLDVLIVEFLPEEDLGMAINDRLRRTLG